MPTIPNNCDIFGTQTYTRVMVPIALYGPLSFWPSNFSVPVETLVDERIRSSNPAAHDSNGTYLSTLNTSSESPVTNSIGFYVESWNKLLDSYNGNYFLYELSSVSAIINIAAVETNGKGYYHQFSGASVYSPAGVLLGTSSGSGELSLAYQTFSFPITPVNETDWNTYWNQNHSPSGAIITIGYYHTHDGQPDNARLTAMTLEVAATYYTAFCFDGSGGIRPPSGDISSGTTFFKMLMSGDK